MAGERRINFGADETDARYQIEDTGDGADFVLARDLDGGTVLLEYDSAASEWVVRGPVNMNNNAITNVSDLDVGTVSTDEADITNETYVEGYLASDKTGNSSGTWVNILDSQEDDARGELNGSLQFTPDETGKYEVEMQAVFTSVNDGDRLQYRIQNITDSIVTFKTELPCNGNFPIPPWAVTVPLTAGKTYEFQARDATSSFDIGSDDKNTRVTVKRSVVHP